VQLKQTLIADRQPVEILQLESPLLWFLDSLLLELHSLNVEFYQLVLPVIVICVCELLFSALLNF
jgi:hypothetical protein